MIISQSKVHHRTNDDLKSSINISKTRNYREPRICSYLIVDNNRSLGDSVHAENGRLRRVDNGSSHHGTVHSTVGDGESSSFEIRNSNLQVAK